jgi:hypothetical protein
MKTEEHKEKLNAFHSLGRLRRWQDNIKLYLSKPTSEWACELDSTVPNSCMMVCCSTDSLDPITIQFISHFFLYKQFKFHIL